LFKKLNITRVFDLRSDIELQKYDAPVPQINGVEITQNPVFKTIDYSPEMIAKYVRAHLLRRNAQPEYMPCGSFHLDDTNFTPVERQRSESIPYTPFHILTLVSQIKAFMELYSQILEHGGPAFGSILRHVRDKPNDGCLFHCTAGKDRTGIIAAILLKVRINHLNVAPRH
jgi:hypothetical protein